MKFVSHKFIKSNFGEEFCYLHAIGFDDVLNTMFNAAEVVIPSFQHGTFHYQIFYETAEYTYVVINAFGSGFGFVDLHYQKGDRKRKKIFEQKNYFELVCCLLLMLLNFSKLTLHY